MKLKWWWVGKHLWQGDPYTWAAFEYVFNPAQVDTH